MFNNLLMGKDAICYVFVYRDTGGSVFVLNVSNHLPVYALNKTVLLNLNQGFPICRPQPRLKIKSML